MENESMENDDLFYAHRDNVFWIDPNGNIFFGIHGYKEMSTQRTNNEHTAQNLIMHSLAINMMQHSTRNVLYNMMFLSRTQLLFESHYVLMLIQSQIKQMQSQNNMNMNKVNKNLYRFVSIYNCIHFVVMECKSNNIDDVQKQTISNDIATRMEQNQLCPCDTLEHMRTDGNSPYVCILPQLPGHFYRNVHVQGHCGVLPPSASLTNMFGSLTMKN